MTFRAIDGEVRWSSDDNDPWGVLISPERMLRVYAESNAPEEAVRDLEEAIAAAEYQRKHVGS